MAEDNRRKEQDQPKKENTKSGRQAGGAPRTAETGAQNNGGQIERGADRSKKNTWRCLLIFDRLRWPKEVKAFRLGIFRTDYQSFMFFKELIRSVDGLS